MNFTKEQAFNVLVQAVSAANKAGVYELKDSATIFAALGLLAPLFETSNGEGNPQGAIEEMPTPKGPKKVK